VHNDDNDDVSIDGDSASLHYSSASSTRVMFPFI
jgi:hypothetical protein